MANMLMFETNKYAIKIDNFEGPLDLLCHLIDKNKMDIYDIKINEIADQYIEYLNQMEEMNLDIASEFLIMASTLIYLKSKSLLPKQDEVEEELIQRIIEYTKYKEIIKKLRVNYEENSKSFFKMPEQIELPKKQIEKDYDKDLIPNLYKTLWNKNKEKINKNAENIQKIAITESYTVTSKVKEMFKALIKNNKFVFNKLFSIEEHNKQEVVTAFSGLLEMSKRDKVNTKQEDLFEDIIVEKKKKIV